MRRLLSSALASSVLASASPGAAPMRLLLVRHAMAAMQRMAPGSELMQELTARRTAFVFGAGVVESARRITSKANLWADLGSRGRIREVCEAAESFGLSPRRVPVPAAWRELTWLA